MKAKNSDKKVEKAKDISKGIDASSHKKPNESEYKTWIAKVMISGSEEICEVFDIQKGDEFELIIEDTTMILIPKKNRPRAYKAILRSATKLFDSEQAAALLLHGHQVGLAGQIPVNVMRTRKGEQEVKYWIERLLIIMHKNIKPSIRKNDLQTIKEQKAWENEVRSKMIRKRKYIKCQKCGWVHFIAPDVEAPWWCFNCGNDDRKTLVKALKKELPVGSTIQPINRTRQGGKLSEKIDKK